MTKTRIKKLVKELKKAATILASVKDQIGNSKDVYANEAFEYIDTSENALVEAISNVEAMK